MSTSKTPPSNSLVIPISIVIAGFIIAGAVVATGSNMNSNSGNAVAQAGNHNAAENGQAAMGGRNRGIDPSTFRMPSEDDHIRGNPDAPVTIVEFSDFECPFCGRLHPTLERVVNESSDVKWVYRHLPLTGIHARALSAAVASECAAKLGGNDAFWNFSDALFESRQGLSTTLYEETATALGINLEEFKTCQESREVADAVRDDLQEAQRIGGTGTPFSVIVTAGGQLVPFSGALPYETILSLVEQAKQS